MERSARAAILDAAVGMVHEHGLAPGVAHVKLSVAARRAGYSAGAAYRHWETQEEFHRDLAVAVLEWRDRSSFADLITSIRALVDAGAPLHEVVRVGAAANLVRLPNETDYFVTLALRAGAVTSPDVAAAARTRVEHGLDEHRRLFEALVELFGLRMRPPFTTAHLAASLGALADGFAVQDVGGDHLTVELDDVGDGVGRDWTLFGVAVRAVVEHLTERCDGGGAHE